MKTLPDGALLSLFYAVISLMVWLAVISICPTVSVIVASTILLLMSWAIAILIGYIFDLRRTGK